MRRNYSEVPGVVQPCGSLMWSRVVLSSVLGALWLWLCLGVSGGLFCSHISKLPGHLPRVPVSRLRKAQLAAGLVQSLSRTAAEVAWQGTMVQRWSTPAAQAVPPIRSQLTREGRRRDLLSLRIEEGACAEAVGTIWVLICCPICCVLPLSSQTVSKLFPADPGYSLKELKQNPQINKPCWWLLWAERGCGQLIVSISPLMVCQNSIVSSAKGNVPALLDFSVTRMSWLC